MYIYIYMCIIHIHIMISRGNICVEHILQRLEVHGPLAHPGQSSQPDSRNSRPMETYGIFMQHVLLMCQEMCSDMLVILKYLSIFYSVFKWQHPWQTNRSDLLYADLPCHRQPFPEGLKHRVIWWSLLCFPCLMSQHVPTQNIQTHSNNEESEHFPSY